MNKLIIIGNLTRDPELRTTQTGKQVCSFTVAVNNGKDKEATFFRVSTWERQAENCQKYLAKGRKVCVIGPVSVSTYQGQDGAQHYNLDVVGQEVEFLSSRQDGSGTAPATGPTAQAPAPQQAAPAAPAPAFTQVDMGDELPF